MHMTQEIIMTIIVRSRTKARELVSYHKYVHGVDLYNSKPSVAGCRFCNKLPKNIKQKDNKNQFTR
jgi:hypothetical protein